MTRVLDRLAAYKEEMRKDRAFEAVYPSDFLNATARAVHPSRS